MDEQMVMQLLQALMSGQQQFGQQQQQLQQMQQPQFTLEDLLDLLGAGGSQPQSINTNRQSPQAAQTQQTPADMLAQILPEFMLDPGPEGGLPIVSKKQATSGDDPGPGSKGVFSEDMMMAILQSILAGGVGAGTGGR